MGESNPGEESGQEASDERRDRSSLGVSDRDFGSVRAFRTEVNFDGYNQDGRGLVQV